MRSRVALPAALVCLLLGTAAAAVDTGHGHGVGVPIRTLLFSAINLLIFLMILGRYALPPVRQWVRDRRNRIVTELEEAAAARGEALRLKVEWEDKVAKLGETARQMREQARQDAERERERILADAHRVAEAIQHDAERTMAAELRRMRIDLRAEVVRDAVKLAEDAVRKQWTAADQRRFVTDFVKQVAK
jgi:F-type H+-transporting ATPase subunit b